jgi:hypothetical protein
MNAKMIFMLLSKVEALFRNMLEILNNLFTKHDCEFSIQLFLNCIKTNGVRKNMKFLSRCHDIIWEAMIKSLGISQFS